MNISQETSQTLDVLPNKNTLKLSFGELAIAEFCGFNSLQQPIVKLSGNSNIPIAFSMISLQGIELGRELIIMPTQQNPSDFAIMGILHKPQVLILDKVIAATQLYKNSNESDNEVFEKKFTSGNPINPISSIKVNGESLVIEAKEEIVFRCGESSIILSKNGKISFRGNYILNRATGLNRILGGSVQIN
jgi:hypothetical protein